MGGGFQQSLVVGVAVASHVVVSVDDPAFDVYFQAGPLAEHLRLGLGVGCVEDIVEGVGHPVDDVQSFLQLGARFGIRDEVIVHASGDVEGGISRYVVIDEDVEGFESSAIDARWVSHIRTAGALHLCVPVGGVAEGCVAVDAEFLLVGGPQPVLHLHGNFRHVFWHSGFGHGGRQCVVAHGLAIGFQLGAGGIFEEVAAELVDRVALVVFHRVGVFQFAPEGELLPVRSLVVGQCLGVHIHRWGAAEEVGGNIGGRQGFHVGFRDGRTPEHALIHLRHPFAEDHRRQRAAVGKGVASQLRDAVGDVHFPDACIGEGIAQDGGDAGGQLDGFQLRQTVEHSDSDHVVLRFVVLVVGYAALLNLHFRQVQRRHSAACDQFSQVFDVGAVDAARHLQFAVAGGQQCGERSCLLHVHFADGQSSGGAATDDGRQQYFQNSFYVVLFHVIDSF